MRDVIALVLLLGGTILTWLIGFRDGRRVERELSQRHYRRQINWLTAELNKAQEKLAAVLRAPPGPQTTEPAWDPEKEPDYE